MYKQYKTQQMQIHITKTPTLLSKHPNINSPTHYKQVKTTTVQDTHQMNFGGQNNLLDMVAYGLDHRGTEVQFAPEAQKFPDFSKYADRTDQGLFPAVKVSCVEADISPSRRLRMHGALRRLLHLHDLVRLLSMTTLLLPLTHIERG